MRLLFGRTTLRAALHASACAGCVLTGAPWVGAQASSETPTAPPSAPTDTLTPPRLLEFVEANVPEDAAQTSEVGVLLELTISPTGEVSAATVVESASESHAAAALDAARRFRFEPARRGDEPVAVTIRYRYVFPAAAPEPSSEATAPPGADPAQPSPAAVPTTATPAAPAAAPEPPAPDPLLDYEATAEVEALPSEPVKRTLSGPVLTQVPGTRGDALRAIEVLPGVGRSGIDNGDPLLRGAAGWESQTLIDGTPVPLLFHFGGLTSVYASRWIESIDLYPSNFSARFGRAIGGVIEVTTRDPKTDRWHGMLELSLLENSALVETPVTDTLAVGLAARRTNIDFVYENLIPDATFDVVAAPVYYDYQALATWRLHPDHTLRLRGYGSRDAIELFFAEPAEDSPTLRGAFDISIEFQRLALSLESNWSRRVHQDLMVTVGRAVFDQAVGDQEARLNSTELFSRGTWRFRVDPKAELRTGFDVAYTRSTGSFYGSRPGQLEGDPNAFSDLNERVGVEDTFESFTPAVYVEAELRPWTSVAITPGVRGEYYSSIDKAVVDPRLALRYYLSDTTTFKAGAGLYSQAPQYYESLPPVGNAELDPVRALHTTAGVEQQVARGVELSLEGFYKRIDDRVVSTEGGREPYFENDGEGRILGMELGAQVAPSPRTRGFFAYTLSRSERRDHDEAWRLFDYDQTHVLSLAFEQALGRGWLLGGRFRVVSGNPETAIVGAVYDARRDAYRPVYGDNNAERAPMFHQLDVRLEKKWSIGEGSVSAYLELINAYNAQNREGTAYSYDFSKKEAVSGLPLFPNIGLRGEL